MSDSVFVKILDKEYQVACQKDEVTALHEAAADLDARMRQIRNQGSVIGLERIAIITALNLSHELVEARRNVKQQQEDDATLDRLNDKVSQALLDSEDRGEG